MIDDTRLIPLENFDEASIYGDAPLPEEPPGFFYPPGELPRPVSPIIFRNAATFAAEYVPLRYTIEPIIRSASIYTETARTGAGKTAFNVVSALAVATGRKDILNLEVAQGRVAYLACENPDDIRMRFKIAAYLLNIDLDEIGDRLLILDFRAKPEAVHAELKRLAEQEPFALVIVDTLAAFFDGDNINDAVQGGQFMRRLRPLTQIKGLPSVLVAAHPVKNASEDALVPYGSGAILNEIDGNLTLWKNPQTGLVSLHWQGKLRGLEFEPVPFRFEIMGCPDILDAKGREVQLPTLRPSSAEVSEDRQQAELNTDRALLLAMIAEPAATQQQWAQTIGRAKSSLNGRLQRLVAEANQGGAMVESTLHAVDATVPVKLVHASRGKITRAEPISALYEQARVHHVGGFPELEDEMCSFEPGSAKSPDRMDALVWALTELMVSSGWQSPMISFHPPTAGPSRSAVMAANFGSLHGAGETAPPGGWPIGSPQALASTSIHWTPNRGNGK